MAGAGSVPRIHSFWTRRAPWFFALKPFLRRRRSVALQLLWRARFAFRNPFRVPLRTGFGILSFDSVRDGGGENPLLQPGEAGNSVEMGVARIEDE